MKRYLKTGGLALTAAFAMSAVAATTAQATNEFAADVKTVITGEQKHGSEQVNRFEFGEAGVWFECTYGTFEGRMLNPTTTLTLEADFHHEDEVGCETNLGTSAAIHMNSCDYTLDALAHTDTHEFSGQVTIDCATEGDKIEITIPTNGSICDITVPPQGPLSGVTYTNITNNPGTSDDEITIDNKSKLLTYTVHRTSIFCPLSEGEFEDGTYTSQITLKGFEDGGVDGEGHNQSYTHNNTQVGLRVKTKD